MANEKAQAPTLGRAAFKRIGMLLNAFHIPPERSPLPDEQWTLLLEMQQKQRERRRSADAVRAERG